MRKRIWEMLLWISIIWLLMTQVSIFLHTYVAGIFGEMSFITKIFSGIALILNILWLIPLAMIFIFLIMLSITMEMRKEERKFSWKEFFRPTKSKLFTGVLLLTIAIFSMGFAIAFAFSGVEILAYIFGSISRAIILPYDLIVMESTHSIVKSIFCGNYVSYYNRSAMTLCENKLKIVSIILTAVYIYLLSCISSIISIIIQKFRKTKLCIALSSYRAGMRSRAKG